jgi:hypothetical protein
MKNQVAARMLLTLQSNPVLGEKIFFPVLAPAIPLVDERFKSYNPA